MRADSDSDDDSDEMAERLLREAVLAARLNPADWTHNEQRMLFGRVCRPDADAQLARPPFELAPYQRDRLVAWHAALEVPLDARLRLLAAYVQTGDCEQFEAHDTLRALARRAGVRTDVRVRAAELAAVWFDKGETALRLITRKWPVYDEVYAAFDAEARHLVTKVQAEAPPAARKRLVLPDIR